MKITSYLPRPGSASTPSPAVTSAPWSPVGSSGPPTPPPPPAPTPAPTAGPGLASGCPCGPRSRRFTSTVSVWPVSAATSRRRPAWGWWRGAGGRMWCTSTPRRSRAGSWSMVRDRVVPASSGALQRFTLLHPVFGQQIKSQPHTTLTLTKKVHVIMIWNALRVKTTALIKIINWLWIQKFPLNSFFCNSVYSKCSDQSQRLV